MELWNCPLSNIDRDTPPLLHRAPPSATLTGILTADIGLLAARDTMETIFP